MFPTRLNLLSSRKRNHLQKMIFFQFTRNILEMTLFVLCISGIALLGGRSILQDHFNDLTTQIAQTTNKYADTNKKIQDINKILLTTEKIQRNYFIWTPVMTEISSKIPKNIVISHLNVDNKNKVITFTGKAPTREDLLNLQEQLESLSFIETIEIPVSALTEKENIPFSITTPIN
jgi:hypothetical protein